MTPTEPLAPPVASLSNALEAVGIVKSFPGVLANDHVDLDLRQGEIHALLGENGAGKSKLMNVLARLAANGAGKSTLMNCLAGLYRPDEGVVRVDGRAVEFRSPRDAITAGIGM